MTAPSLPPSGAPAGAESETQLEAELAAAEAKVAQTRKDNAELAEAFRNNPSDAARDQLKQAASNLALAREQVEHARTALELFKKTGSIHGLLAREGTVVGTVAIRIEPGTTKKARTRLIDEALSAALTDAATELGVVLVASPENFTRERPGRTSEGETVFDVLGRVEGDVLVPAVSRQAKLRS